MIIGRTGILLSQTAITGATAIPAHRLGLGDWTSEFTLIVDVQSVNGAPTTASLVITPQFVVPHTTGNQYVNERLVNLDATQKLTLTMEGEDWPNPVCTQASSFPVSVQRTYVGFGKDMRFVFTPTFSGGTSPSFTVTVVIQTKG